VKYEESETASKVPLPIQLSKVKRGTTKPVAYLPIQPLG